MPMLCFISSVFARFETQEIQDELVAAGFLKPPSEAVLAAKGAAKGRKATKSRQKQKGGAAAGGGAGGGFRQYTSPGGFQVLVGRNNTQNDQLSLKVGGVIELERREKMPHDRVHAA